MELTATEIIEQLYLQPHPEGGYYRETYRSPEKMDQNYLPERFHGDRSFATAIYYLLMDEDFSGFHRIKSEECWHHYLGKAIHLYILDNEGVLVRKTLGCNILAGEEPQIIVPAKAWFSAHISGGIGYALVGCTVAPGFDFADFEMGKQEELINRFPQFEDILLKYCRL